MKLSFDALEILDAIDRKGSFAAAAGVLNRVPSALSYQIQKLESDLGVVLFDRTGRHAKLTLAGRTVVDEGRRLLGAARDLQLRAQRIECGWPAHARLYIDELLPLDAMWPHVDAFCSYAVHTHLSLYRGWRGETWQALRSGDADLVVGAAGEPPEPEGLVTHSIGCVRYVFAVSRCHPLARAPEPLSADVIRRYRGIDTEDSLPDIGEYGDAGAWQSIGVPTLVAKLEAMCAGIVMGVLPEHVAREAVSGGRLVVKQVDGMRDVARIYLAWRKGEKENRALKWWIERLRNQDISGWLARDLQARRPSKTA
ncbi:LysR family transcriptional regulator [Paraburkholderia caballeronis]|uniref:DNA-binding transcriptional regulator, LysR family n=1 Tax=Paraburkholderia caballeronis TaxID=416943 RepID=A0A1H7L4N9_9BURK|nr:LysR family transcriptional regulator [Paraburkholderia caballeronis]PXW28291.1 DNA-binding transcriptional LysR family regulator [Paraburkholderia caballeronis]PXX03657.1 DNA-binding transcriptional LysR family regulator [Paraburkholderia caballeronis]RAK04401.1 DNA-binding transcriptional LysR family regulator [Paraburkholderia caballeronis]SED81719.1 DNA-binding transcriptional regulator, LysR family [Paraburkholderia caballeronis]SEK93928.1 DNA-binding transcriptional regulator, LysR fa